MPIDLLGDDVSCNALAWSVVRKLHRLKVKGQDAGG